MAEKDQDNIFDLNTLLIVWKVIRKNWYWFILFPALGGAASYFYTHRLTDVYAVKSQLLLKSSETTSQETQMFANFGYYDNYRDITNQKRIITSYDLVESAVEKMDLEVSYYIVGRIKTTEVYGSMPFDVDVVRVDGGFYNKRFDMKILNTDEFQLSYEHNGETVSETFRFGEPVKAPYFYFHISDNSQLNEGTVNNLREINYQFSVKSESGLVGKYKSSLSVENIQHTSILVLSVEDVIPQRAQEFLDTLSQTYIDFSIKAEYDVNTNTVQYIDRQLNKVRDIISRIEEDIESYKNQRSIINLSREEESFYTRLVEHESQKRGLQLQLNTIASLEKYLLRSDDSKLLPPSMYVLSEDEFIRTALSSLYSMQMERNSMLYSSKESNLSISRLDKEMGILKNQLLTYLDNTENAIHERISELNGEITKYESKLRRVPKTERELMNIQRKIDINEKLYTFLLEKRANTVIARAGIVPETKVIERPRSFGVVRPDKGKITNMFLIGGLILAGLIAFLRSILFYRIESVRELSGAARIPVLGGIPFSDQISLEKATDLNPKSSISESFRGIRTNLQYLGSGKRQRASVMVLTSINPSEGKTFSASNLALILARASKKVLLIDFDLHKPRIHKAFEVQNEAGVSTYLSGRNTLEEIVQPTDIEHLNIITSGPIPPNASELVLKKETEQMFDHFKDQYEYILIDTPPLSLISDGMALLGFADVGLFIMNTKHATRGGIRYIEELCDKTGLESKGLVLNGIKMKRWRYYYGKYGYGGYGYGYGYGGYGDGDG